MSRLAVIGVVSFAMQCSEPQYGQSQQGITEAPSVELGDAGVQDDVRRDPDAARMVEFIPRLPRPIPDEPIFSDAGIRDAAFVGRIIRTRIQNPTTHLRESLAAGWLIVAGRVASTPSTRDRRLPRLGQYGRDLVLRDAQFEFDAATVCSTNNAPQVGRYIVNHRGAILHERQDGALEASVRDPLDSRPRRAVVSEGLERLLVLSHDSQADRGWLLIDSVNVENGAIQEAALGFPRGTSVNDAMMACFAALRGGAR